MPNLDGVHNLAQNVQCQYFDAEIRTRSTFNNHVVERLVIFVWEQDVVTDGRRQDPESHENQRDL